MKKTFLLFLALPLFSFSQFNFGVKGGGLISNIKTENDFFDKNRMSFYFGGFAEYKPSNFALNGSLEYMDLGAKRGGDIESISVKQINLSITGKYYFSERFSALVGGYLGYILGGDAKINLTRLNIHNPSDPMFGPGDVQKISFDDELKSIDTGLKAGVEFNIYKGLFVEARYMLGLNNIFKDINFRESYDDPGRIIKIKSKNRVFLFGVGYKF